MSYPPVQLDDRVEAVVTDILVLPVPTALNPVLSAAARQPVRSLHPVRVSPLQQRVSPFPAEIERTGELTAPSHPAPQRHGRADAICRRQAGTAATEDPAQRVVQAPGCLGEV